MTKFDLDSISGHYLTLHLFQNVRNIAELRKKLISGQLQCCLINPKLIVDPFQVIVAANKALVSSNRTTKTVFTEILFNLSISKNITKSLQQFGVGDNNTEVLLVMVHDSKDTNPEESNALNEINEIEGDEVDLKFLSDVQDLNLIKKVYKITDVESRVSSLIDSVVSRIATKDFVSH